MALSVHEQLIVDNDYFKKVIGLVPNSFINTELESNDSRFGLAETSVHERLHKKIEVLKGKRLKPGRAVESLEKKRLKRKLSKAKLRQRRKAEKQNLNAEKNSASHVAGTSVVASKPVFNKEGNVVFSKFELSDSSSAQGKQKSEVPTGKNYKALLNQVEKQKQKIKKTAETNPEQARKMEEKLKWKTALSKAEGVKVRDNPELLKKSVKKQEKRKEQSRRKWEDREKKVTQQMKQRQEKRASNIAKKKEGRKEKKLKLAKKKGRFVG